MAYILRTPSGTFTIEPDEADWEMFKLCIGGMWLASFKTADEAACAVTKRETGWPDVWRFAPAWSPDSKTLAFGDRKQRLRIVDVASGAVSDVDRGTQEDLDTYTWSPDARWLAYEKSHPTRIPGLAVYSVEQKKVFVLGDGLTPDFSPAFGADGTHLFFLSNRDYRLTFSAYELDYLYADATRVYAAALTPDGPALFPPRSDEEKGGEPETRAAGAHSAGQVDPAKSAPARPAAPAVKVVPEGFVARTVWLHFKAPHPVLKNHVFAEYIEKL